MKIFRWVGTIIMFLIVYEVTARYIFNEPTKWGNDVQLYLSAAQRCIGIGFATMVHSHITMDIFTTKMSFKKQKVLELFGYIVYHLPLMYALTWATTRRGLQTLVTKEKYYSVWRPYLYPILFFIVGAYILFIMQILAETIKDVISLQKGSDAWLKER